MDEAPRSWLDALTDGQWIRDWTSLNAHFVFGLFYWSVLWLLFGIGISLAFILVGIPLLLLAFHSMRTLAAIDHQAVAALLDRPARQLDDDLEAERGGTIWRRFGHVLRSAQTWRSLIYVALKLPIGAVTLGAAWFLLPFMAFEMLILGPLTLSNGTITLRLLHALAIFSHEWPAMLLPETQQREPREKSKRDLRVRRLEVIEDDEEVPGGRYILTDDGEVEYKQR
jgi:hypothetical protein